VNVLIAAVNYRYTLSDKESIKEKGKCEARLEPWKLATFGRDCLVSDSHATYNSQVLYMAYVYVVIETMLTASH